MYWTGLHDTGWVVNNDPLHAGETESWQLLRPQGWMPQLPHSGAEGLNHSWRDIGLPSKLEDQEKSVLMWAKGSNSSNKKGGGCRSRSKGKCKQHCLLLGPLSLWAATRRHCSSEGQPSPLSQSFLEMLSRKCLEVCLLIPDPFKSGRLTILGPNKTKQKIPFAGINALILI